MLTGKKEKDEQDHINRQRQAEVAFRIKTMLGKERFDVLKDTSVSLQHPSGSLMATDELITQYIKTALNIFRDARSVDIDDKNVEDSKVKQQMDVESLYILSELVALLPDDLLRERILLKIESHVERLEGRKPNQTTTVTSQDLPELNEDDLSEKFVRGSGAGGQKINKTANRVILVHIPTQLRVECQDTRSLQQNRKIARKRLRLKLDEFINGEKSRTGLKGAKVASKKAKTKAKNRARQRKKAAAKEED